MPHLGIQIDPHHVAAIRGPLNAVYHFLPDWRSGRNFMMQILIRNQSEELIECEVNGGHRLDEQPATGDRQIDRGVRLKPDLLGKRLGNPERQAISPLLNPCSHALPPAQTFLQRRYGGKPAPSNGAMSDTSKRPIR